MPMRVDEDTGNVAASYASTATICPASSSTDCTALHAGYRLKITSWIAARPQSPPYLRRRPAPCRRGGRERFLGPLSRGLPDARPKTRCARRCAHKCRSSRHAPIREVLHRCWPRSLVRTSSAHYSQPDDQTAASSDPVEARRLYASVATSKYPLHQALGHLGLAILDSGSGNVSPHAQRAETVAASIGQRLISSRIAQLRTGSPNLSEIFFC
jgi:hypothetical protein